MKNIISLIEPKEIKDFVNNLWQTEEFKKSCTEENGYINSIVAQFSDHPRFFYEVTDDTLERGHFTSWMNAISFRKYENPVIQDLYYLHEILHATTMRYNQKLDFSRWKGKMIDNEVEVSLDSEVLVYLKLITLRPKSFDFEIWADSLTDLNMNDPDFRKNLKKERVRIYKTPNPKSKPELEIAKYHLQNEEWSKVWKDNYLEIERALEHFYLLSKTSKQEASKFLKSWFDQQLEKGICPFQKEARAVAKIYWKNKNG
jgi:hypothetical protein